MREQPATYRITDLDEAERPRDHQDKRPDQKIDEAQDERCFEGHHQPVADCRRCEADARQDPCDEETRPMMKVGSGSTAPRNLGFWNF